MKSIIAALALLAMFAPPVNAQNTAPYSGMVTVETGKPFKSFVKAVKPAIKQHKFGIIGIACANCAIKNVYKKTVPGNRVFFFFAPRFAIRMLAASTAAGIEAPIRIYATENPDGSAKVTYRLPSHVFGAYEVDALTAMGKELDGAVEAIVASAIAGTK